MHAVAMQEEEPAERSKRSAKRPPMGRKGIAKPRVIRTTKAHHTKVSRKSAVPESKANDKRKVLDKGTRLRKK